MKATDLPRVPGIPRTPLWSGGRSRFEAGAFKDEPSVIVGYLYDLDAIVITALAEEKAA